MRVRNVSAKGYQGIIAGRVTIPYMDDVSVLADDAIRAEEVVELRLACQLDGDLEEWQKVLPACMVTISARTQDGRLVGAGFLAGTARHAELTDLAVHPDFRRRHLGEKITKQLLEYARREHVRYITLYSDPASPWLKKFYAKLGFRSVDFGMWYEGSIPPPQ